VVTPQQYALISRLFGESVALDTRRRQAFLNEQCAGNPSLRAEVEKMLGNDAKAIDERWLDEPLSLPFPFPAAPRDPMIGRRIGVYEIHSKIGSGGMGDVYLAIRRDDIRLRVAVKLIKRDTDSQAILQRFRNERQILAALQHANIARFLDGGTTDDGSPYFAMEYIEGKPIDQYCDDRRLNTTHRLELFQAVCAAVQFAHKFGVIHRDLSPDNVRVTADGVPKLLDFGIAKMINPELSFVSEIGPTQPEDLIMKRAYASPEQVRGGAVSTASDVYSLGVVLYRLLTGHPPYRFPSQAPAEVARAVCEVEPEAPSAVVMRGVEVTLSDGTTKTVTPEKVSEVRDGLPARLRRRLAGEVDKIVLMALKKEPDRRFASVEQFAEDIRRHLQGLPLRYAVRDSFVYRARKFARRNRVLVAAAALVVLLLVGGTAGTTLGMFRAWDAEAEANWRKEDADNARKLAVNEQEKAQQALAELSLQEAFERCGRGEPGLGLLSFAQALDAAADGKAPDLERVIRANLLGWRRQLVALTDCLTPPPNELFAFTPDGCSAWTVTGEGSLVRRWELAEGRLADPSLKHAQPVVALALSLDGSYVATGCTDRGVRLWDAATGELRWQAVADKREISAVGFSPDCQTVMVGRIEKEEREESTVFEALCVAAGEAGPPAFRLPGRVRRFALSPDGGRTLVTVGSLDRAVRRWELPTGRAIGTDLSHQEWVRAVAFSPDGRAILTGGDDRVARLWETASGRPLQVLYHQKPVWAVAFGPDGRRFLTASLGDAVRVWNGTPFPEPLHTLAHRGPVRALDVSPDGKWVVTGAADWALHLWDSSTGKEVPLDLPHDFLPRFAAFSPDGTLLVTTRYQRNGNVALLWDFVPGTPRPLRKKAELSHRGDIRKVAFSCDGTRLATASMDGTAQVWNTATGLPALAAVLHHDGKAVSAVAFSPDGTKVLTGGADGNARRWNVATGEPFGRPLPQGGAIVDVAFSPDGRMMLTAGKDGWVRCWDAASGEKALEFDHGGSAVGVVAFRPPDGRTILTSSLNTARLWNAATGQRRGALLRHPGEVLAAAFSRDGRWVVTGSKDGMVRVWDSDTGRPLGPPLLHDETAHLVAVGPAGSGWFVTASTDKVARLWPVPTFVEAAVPQVVRWAQVRTGLELDPAGGVQVTDAGSWHQRRQFLQEIGGFSLP
jgi:WD40 repeat protein/serine/threonine protein kinase